MNYDIRFRSWRSVLLGALVTLAGIVGAMLSSPWWLLLLPIGATNIFRLERNVAAAMLTELRRLRPRRRLHQAPLRRPPPRR